MFWFLVLAHLIADYPLQPTWMVSNKTRWSVLALHALIHFAVGLLVVGSARSNIGLQLLVLALIHLVIDLGKNSLNRLRPKWVIMPYLVDQLLHFTAMWFIGIWIDNQISERLSTPRPFWLVLFIGYLLVTYVWHVSERILTYTNLAYREEVVNRIWSRIFTRATLLSGMLFIMGWLFPFSLSPAFIVHLPYFSGKYRLRILLTDLVVSMGGLIFIIWTV